MAVDIISRSISTKVWGQAGIELTTPGSAIRHVSAVRQVTDCAMWSCTYSIAFFFLFFVGAGGGVILTQHSAVERKDFQ